MILASDAKRRTQEQLSYMTSIEIDHIMEKIEEAISKGEFSISTNGSLSASCRQKLEKLGYKVDTGIQYNEAWYNVSWK